MAKGMLRGAGAAWLGLIVLQAVTTDQGSGAIGGMLGTISGLVQRAFDPDVAAIPDHSAAAPAPATTPAPSAAPSTYIPWPSVPGTYTA